MQIMCVKCLKENREIAKYCKNCGEKIINEQFKLEDLLGLDSVKKEIKSIIERIEAIKISRSRGGNISNINLNTIITGNSGTGKSHIVEVLAQTYFKNKITKTNDILYINHVDFYDFNKDLKANLNKAKGSIIFIDNAHRLLDKQLDKLFSEMEIIHKSKEFDPIIFLSGMPGEIKQYFSQQENNNVKNLFKYIFDLPVLNSFQLTDITVNKFEKDGFKIDQQVKEKIISVFNTLERKTAYYDFLNGHEADKKIEEIKSNYYLRTKNDKDTKIIISDDIKGDIEPEKTEDEILKDLDMFIGMTDLKKHIKDLSIQIKFNLKHGDNEKISMHIVFTGNPGTGKTSVAKKIGDLFRSINLLKRGHVVEVVGNDLKGQYVGGTSPIVNKKCDEAMGGILFIDEAYTLAPDNDSGISNTYGKEAIDTLMTRMDADRGKFIVIVAGYKDEMYRFINNTNPGIPSRFNKTIHFDDYNETELYEIFNLMANQKKYQISDNAKIFLKKVFKHMYETRDKKKFGNGRDVRNLFENSCRQLAIRLSNNSNQDFKRIIEQEDIVYILPKEITIEEALGELNSLIGLEEIKKQVEKWANTFNIQKRRAEANGMSFQISTHIVITGNPGTGKTTIARILAKVLKSLSILKTDKITEVDRSGLVSPYKDGTPRMTNNKIDEAMGGVLFIDEAYTLAPKSLDDTGQQVIDTLMKRMDSDNGKFVVIAAGYPKEMDRFINSNQGLPRRFKDHFEIKDYTPEELFEIFMLKLKNNHFIIDDDAKNKIKEILMKICDNKDEKFGNAGEVEKLLSKCVINQSNRLSLLKNFDDKDISVITFDDIPKDNINF